MTEISSDLELAPSDQDTATSDGRSVVLTERDRELMRALACARFLSHAQIGALIFAGKSRPVVARRLHSLAGNGTSLRTPYLRQLEFRDYSGLRRSAWTLAERGALLVSDVFGGPSRRTLSARYLEHALLTNDLFVALARSFAPADLPVTMARLPFRWLGPDRVRLDWQSYDQALGRARDRLIVPDATLELPALKRRFLLEVESGENPLQAADKHNATSTKLSAYASMLTGVADPTAKQTWYARAFPDLWQPEVVFLSLSAARRDSILKVIAKWRARADARARTVAFSAVAIPDAAAHFRDLVGAPPAMPSPSPTAPALSSDDIAALASFYREAIATIQSVRHAIRDHKPLSSEPSYPSSHAAVRALLEKLGTG